MRGGLFEEYTFAVFIGAETRVRGKTPEPARVAEGSCAWCDQALEILELPDDTLWGYCDHCGCSMKLNNGVLWATPRKGDALVKVSGVAWPIPTGDRVLPDTGRDGRLP